MLQLEGTVKPQATVVCVSGDKDSKFVAGGNQFESRRCSAGRAVAASYILRRLNPMQTAGAGEHSAANDSAVVSAHGGVNAGHHSAEDDATQVKVGSPKAAPLGMRRPRSAAGTLGRDLKKDTRLREPERRFLHQALLAIGAEVEERSREDGRIQALLWSARGADAVIPVKRPVSAKHRDTLRQNLKQHTDHTTMELRRCVEHRAGEVLGLKTQLEQLEDRLAATRLATARRKVRLEAGNTRFTIDETNSATEPSSNPALPKQKIPPHLVAEHRSADKEHVSADWDRQIQAHLDEVAKLKLSVEHDKEAYGKLLLHRKSVETTLFTSNMEALRVRNLALQQESRCTRLSHELLKVYKALPREIEKRLGREGPSASERASREFHTMCELSRPHFYKFMNAQEQVVEQERLECQAGATHKRCEAGEQALRALASHSLENMGASIANGFRVIDKSWDYIVANTRKGQTILEAKIRGKAEETSLLLLRAQELIAALKVKLLVLSKVSHLRTTSQDHEALNKDIYLSEADGKIEADAFLSSRPSTAQGRSPLTIEQRDRCTPSPDSCKDSLVDVPVAWGRVTG